MRLAIVNNERSAPSPGLAGFCPACGKPLIPRCGSQRVHHWAHRSERACDHWWEPETGWHRSWKLQFPEDWQEIVLHAATGERHIADVRTAQGLTIEFQHSHLKPEERTAREDFYGEMVWVVDGLRLRRDLPRFREGARDLRNLKAGRVYLHRFPDQLFPSSWTKRNAPVFIDFSGGAAPVQSLAPVERSLWCLLPQRDATWGVVLRFSRDEFVLAARNDPTLLLGRSVLSNVGYWLAAERKKRIIESLRYRTARPAGIKPRSRRWRSASIRRF